MRKDDSMRLAKAVGARYGLLAACLGLFAMAGCHGIVGVEQKEFVRAGGGSAGASGAGGSAGLAGSSGEGGMAGTSAGSARTTAGSAGASGSSGSAGSAGSGGAQAAKCPAMKLVHVANSCKNGGATKSCGPMMDQDCCDSFCVEGGEFWLGRGVAEDGTAEGEKGHDAGACTTPGLCVYYKDELNTVGGKDFVSTYYLDRYEVTVARFREFVSQYDAVVSALVEGAGAHPKIPLTGWVVGDGYSPNRR